MSVLIPLRVTWCAGEKKRWKEIRKCCESMRQAPALSLTDDRCRAYVAGRYTFVSQFLHHIYDRSNVVRRCCYRCGE